MAYDFPNSPTVGQTYQGYTWDGEKWTLPTTTPAPVPALKNYIVNGAMQVSQENGLAAGVSFGSGFYPVDQFFFNGLGTSAGVSMAQVASRTPAGSPNRIRMTITAADAAVGAGDLIYLQQRIEGLRTADLMAGTAAAKTVTLRFGVKAPAGTYSVWVMQGAGLRAYVTEFVITAGEANTDVVKSVTLAMDPAGGTAWPVDNTVAVALGWTLMAGTTYQAAPNVWSTNSNGLATANQFNFCGTNGNVFELFDVGLYVGTVAPGYVVPDYAHELDQCKRYYERRNFVANQFLCTLQCVTGASANGVLFHFPEKRAAPTVQLFPGATSFNLQAAAGGGGALNNIINIGVNPVSYWAQPTIASGLVAGNAASMFSSGTTYVSFNARM
jgi:hypothetical protein